MTTSLAVASNSGRWTHDAQGHQADPVTIEVHGSLEDLSEALQESGWTRADPQQFRANARYLGNAAKEVVNRGRVHAEEWFNSKFELPGGVFHPKYHRVADIDRMPMSPQTLHVSPAVAEFERNND